jgi:insertion element IS1 protein InsB
LGSCFRAAGELGCGGRDKATCQRLIARLQRWRTRLYCTDEYAVYDVLLQVGQHYAGQDEAHGIERDNAWQRYCLTGFARRSIVVFRAKRMVDVSLAHFAHFAENSRISDLLSMLTQYPPDWKASHNRSHVIPDDQLPGLAEISFGYFICHLRDDNSRVCERLVQVPGFHALLVPYRLLAAHEIEKESSSHGIPR